MIPGIHYPENEQYSYPERQTKCPHCGYIHAADISFYKECIHCHKVMSPPTPKNKDMRKFL